MVGRQMKSPLLFKDISNAGGDLFQDEKRICRVLSVLRLAISNQMRQNNVNWIDWSFEIELECLDNFDLLLSSVNRLYGKDGQLKPVDVLRDLYICSEYAAWIYGKNGMDENVKTLIRSAFIYSGEELLPG